MSTTADGRERWSVSFERGPTHKTAASDGPDRAYGRAFAKRGQEDSEAEETWKELKASVADDALSLIGHCPLCTHDIDDFVSLSPEWVTSWVDGEEHEVETLVQCNCTAEHDGRPDDHLGCGALARVTVGVKCVPGTYSARVKEAAAGTARDRSWDEEAGKWEQAMTTRLAQTAEKWGQTVAALFAIFGVSVVLEGERLDAVLASTATWPSWVLFGFLTVTAATMLVYLEVKARRDEGEPPDDVFRWGALVAVALAVLALAVAADERLQAGAGFGVLVGLAAALALTATGFAGLAAQGSPKWVPYLTGNRLRRLRLESADATVRNLRRARVATALALVALGCALAVLWYAPAAPEGPAVRLFTDAGLEPCGELLSRGDAGVAIDPQGADDFQDYAIADLQRIRAVDSCEP